MSNTKADRTKAQIRFFIALTVVGLFAGCLLGLFFIPLTGTNATVLQVVTGFLGGAFTTMVAYYFGDAEGKDKPPVIVKDRRTGE